MAASRHFAAFIKNPLSAQIRKSSPKRRSTSLTTPQPRPVSSPSSSKDASCETWIDNAQPINEQDEKILCQSLVYQETEHGVDEFKGRDCDKETTQQKKKFFTSSFLGGRKEEKGTAETGTGRVTVSSASGSTVQTPARFLMQKHLIARILDSREKLPQRMIKEKENEKTKPQHCYLSKSLTSPSISSEVANRKTLRSANETGLKISPLAREDSQPWFNRLRKKGLWCEQEHVIKSGILEKLSNNEKQFQETLFEVIISEENHLKALEILVGHFKASLECRYKDEIDQSQNRSFSQFTCQDAFKNRAVLKKYEFEMLFCNIETIRDLSRQIVSEYDSLQGDELLVQNYLDFFADFVDASLRKSVVKYCSNMKHQREMFQHLMSSNSDFAEKIMHLENQGVTDRTFSSFLITPMTRVCHMPLLIEKIVKIGEKLTSNYAVEITESAKKVFEIVQSVASECNQETRKLEEFAEKQKILLAIEKTLLIPLDIQLNLITASRTLLCECNAIQVLPSTNLFKNNIEVKLHFKLFHDILLICKPVNDMFEVLDVADVGSGSVFLSALTKENEDHFLSRAKFLSPSQIQKQPISLVFFRTKVGDAPNLKRAKSSTGGTIRTTHELKTWSQSFQDNANLFIIQPQEKRNLFVSKLQSCLSLAEKRNSTDANAPTRKLSGRRRSSLNSDIKNVVQGCAAHGSTSSKFEVEHIAGSTVYLSLSLSSSTDYHEEEAGVVSFSRNSAFSPLYLQDISNFGVQR